MFYETPKGKIYYEKVGTGPGVLILHGLGGSYDSMENISLNMDGFTRILADIPCHGLSDNMEVSLDEISEMLVNLMKSEGLEKFNLIGISLGSLISQKIALNFPNNILKISLLSPAPFIDEEAVNMVSQWITTEDGGASTLFSKKFYEENKDKIMEYEKTHPLQPERLYNLIPGIINFDVRGKAVDKKCLIIYGKEDKLFGERMVPELRKLFPKSKVVALNSGHAIHRESPEEAALIIKSFMEEWYL